MIATLLLLSLLNGPAPGVTNESEIIRAALFHHFEDLTLPLEPGLTVLVNESTKEYDDVRPWSQSFDTEIGNVREAIQSDFVIRNRESIAVHATIPENAVYADVEPFRAGESFDWSLVHEERPAVGAIAEVSRPGVSPDGRFAIVLVEEFRPERFVGRCILLRLGADGRWEISHVMVTPRPAQTLEQEKKTLR